MTNEERKLIFDYCGWDGTTTVEGYAIDTPECRPLDGNDMKEAVRVMEERGELLSFEDFIREKYYEVACSKSKLGYYVQNFFPLMAEWLKERGRLIMQDRKIAVGIKPEQVESKN